MYGLLQGMRLEFGSAGAVCSIEESSGPQNLWVSIVLKASNSACVKGDTSPKDLQVRATTAPLLTHSLCYIN